MWRPLPFAGVERPAELPEFYRHYYDYPPPSLAGTLVREKKKEGFILRTFEIPLSLPADLAPPDLETLKGEVEALFKTDEKTARDLKLQYVNRIDFYLPRNLKPGERRPVIVISPILGGNMVVDHFAEYYTGRGYIAALVNRKRIQWREGEDAAQVERYLRISVMRLRQALDWLMVQPEVDSNRIGAFGISYGAILHSVLAAVDGRVRYHILAMPAAPLPEVIRDCPDRAIKKLRKNARNDHGWSDGELFEELRRVVRTDPIFLARSVPHKRVQVYVALFDRVVGVGRSFRLWKAMGRPTLKILPFGHYGSITLLPYLQTSSYLTFRRHLG